MRWLAAVPAEGTLSTLQAAMQREHKTAAVRALRQKSGGAGKKGTGQGATPALIETARIAALFNAGHYAKLENHIRRLLLKQPNSGFAWKVLGVSLQAQGKDGLAALQKAAELLPKDADTHNNLGNTLRDNGQFDSALASYQRALEIKPDFAEAHCNLGATLRGLGLLERAAASYQRALEIKPGFVLAHYNLGNVLQDLGRINEAAANYRRALEIKPDFTDALRNLAIALRNLGQFDGVAQCCRRLLEINPNDADAHCDLGAALKILGRLDDAVANFQRALEIKPDFALAHCNLGSALVELGQFDRAVTSYAKALEIQPDFAEAHSYLGSALLGLGQLDGAAVSFAKALEIKPDVAWTHSSLLFCLSHNEAFDVKALFAEHCRFAERFETPLRNGWPQHSNLRNPERCLQVGIVSGDLRRHAVAFFVEPVLARLAGYPQLSLHVYYNNTIEDDVTRRLRGILPHWNAIAGLTDEVLAQKICEDGIDILLDLSGHTAQNRLLAFARKPAPLQVTWLGYPNTTGLQAMDYVLKDRFIAPYGTYERYYVEKLVRLPCSGTFLPVEDAPAVNDLPARSTGSVTFGSFNRPGKLGDGVIALWSRVLHAVPGSRLLLGNAEAGDLRVNLAKRFARCGVSADRLAFRPRMEMNAYLALHHQVDFLLDSFPYTGGTTTSHALWMGVPVLTLAGASSMQCQCAGVLRRVALEDWVAKDAEDFVRRGVDWCGRLDELAGLRAGMRERLRSSRLQQPETVASGLETAFRVMWRRWCEGLPAESFEVEMKDLGLVQTKKLC